jgi:hypothetical protein
MLLFHGIDKNGRRVMDTGASRGAQSASFSKQAQAGDSR